MCLIKQKKLGKYKKTFNIYSVLYFTLFEYFEISIEKSNKIASLNDFVAKYSNAQVQISINSKKRLAKKNTHN